MDLPARPIATVTLPFARRLLSHSEGWHRTPGGLLAAMRVENRMRVYHIDRLLAGDRALLDGDNEADDGYWRYKWNRAGAFVDDQTVLAVLGGPDHALSHWLLKTPADLDQEWARLVRGRVRYETEPPALHHVRALGDGIWLTADEQSIQRWTLA